MRGRRFAPNEVTIHVVRNGIVTKKYVFMIIALISISPGFAGGPNYGHSGGGSNYQCLPGNPQWGHHTDGLMSNSYMQGAEYLFSSANSPFLKVI